ncbi:hypothetical protein N8Z19_00035 [Saprospiraceae bacterium]|nr:hypothetical protein [Saprospiraceae bacterium]
MGYKSRIKRLESVLAQKNEFVDLLNSELSSINTTLDGINEDQFFSDSNAIDPLVKIAKFDSLLILGQNRISELENIAKKRTSNADSRLLNSIISNLNKKLFEKEKSIALLKIENDSLKFTNEIQSDSIINLTVLKSKLLADVSKQEGKLDSVKNMLEREKRELEIEKENLKKDLYSSKEQIEIEKRNSYFEFAVELLDEYNNTSTNFLQRGKKKMKVNLLNSSYENFRKACFLGHPESKLYIRKLLSSEPYIKDLKLTRSSKSNFSSCGI